MTQQYVPNLGSLPTEDARRDCVHVAVAPMVASHSLPPGYLVRLLENGQAVGCDGNDRGIGIVDPFLSHWVNPGERFWLFLHPQTITGLRHVWFHDAFKAKVPGQETE